MLHLMLYVVAPASDSHANHSPSAYNVETLKRGQTCTRYLRKRNKKFAQSQSEELTTALTDSVTALQNVRIQ